MKIAVIDATQEDKLKILHTAFCNGAGYLLGFCMDMDYNDDDYAVAREQLGDPCLEDVYIQMIRNGAEFTITDPESDDENEITGRISLATLLANWDKVPADMLSTFINEEDDAYTAVDFMQYIAFGETIYG